ncbi:hypothetical protein AB9P05_19235 [Roseivirga sp. BDSF3-8]|uniref:hypothetical protein n=1 Tax=Roseivirga sp. BDSF3-8 TaxID=3241598 RepID=UPI003531D837
MLFTYRHIPNHPIYQLQTWVDELFLDVWCKADRDVPYDIDLLPKDIKEVTLEIFYDESVKTDYLYGPIQEVYTVFQTLDQPTKDKLAKAYKDNNYIASLCANTGGCEPFRYKDLKAIDVKLSKLLKKFYTHLFKNVIKLKAVSRRLGTLKEHHDEFVTLNNKGNSKCPFCGINNLKTRHRKIRNAYDHYLPKSVYPFNSINFDNLAPMCYECNLSCKSTRDPIIKKDKKTRRKAFYPYKNPAPELAFSFKLNNKDIDTLQPEEFDLEVTSHGHREEVETWMEIFDIEERYKEKCLPECDGKYWVQQAVDEYYNSQHGKVAGRSRAECIAHIINIAENNRLNDNNFIKAAFLRAWKKSNII